MIWGLISLSLLHALGIRSVRTAIFLISLERFSSYASEPPYLFNVPRYWDDKARQILLRENLLDEFEAALIQSKDDRILQNWRHYSETWLIWSTPHLRLKPHEIGKKLRTGPALNCGELLWMREFTPCRQICSWSGKRLDDDVSPILSVCEQKPTGIICVIFGFHFHNKKVLRGEGQKRRVQRVNFSSDHFHTYTVGKREGNEQLCR